MKKNKYLAGLLLTGFVSLSFGCLAQSETRKEFSLCSLQQKVTEGSRQTVLISGIYGPSLDHAVLEEPSCSKEGTWVELDLQSNENKNKLHKLLNRSRRAYVVFEGDFYGPPTADSKLPEAIRSSYHPGWGHLAAFKTKLIVHAIREVKAAPPVKLESKR